MIDDLVGVPAVVLQDIVVLGAGGYGELLADGLVEGKVQASVWVPWSQGVGGIGGWRTRTSASESSGMSVSFAPWCLGITSWTGKASVLVLGAVVFTLSWIGVRWEAEIEVLPTRAWGIVFGECCIRGR